MVGIEKSTDWVTVHDLKEFVFCPRAGLLSFEAEREDRDWQETLAKLDFRHVYDEEVFYEQLKLASRNLALAIVALIVAAFVVFLIQPIVVRVLGVALALYCLREVLIALGDVIDNLQGIDGLKQAAQEPNPDTFQDERINWWAMKASGFERIKQPPAYRDQSLHIAGQPNLLLRRGRTAIPVFRRQQEGEITPQQRIKIAAYCYLIQQASAEHAPYGIILDPEGYGGTAIKATKQLIESLKEQRTRFSESLKRSREQDDPPPPTRNAKCLACPHGAMIKVTADAKEIIDLRDRGITPNVLYLVSDGEAYASTCGSRFAWLPSHAHVVRNAWTQTEPLDH